MAYWVDHLYIYISDLAIVAYWVDHLYIYIRFSHRGILGRPLIYIYQI